MANPALHLFSWLMVALGLVACVIVVIDIRRRQPQPMAVMNFVWPINALWAGLIGIWIYWKLGRTGSKTHESLSMQAAAGSRSEIPRSSMSAMKMSGAHGGMKMDEKEQRPFWQKVVAGTLHCGAGCTLADLVGPFVFMAIPFAVFGSMVFAEWTLDFVLALLVGVTFQYAAISPMLGQTGPRIWWRALKVDFLSLTAWQVGMYGWMALVIFVWFGRIPPSQIEFWFLMQVAMACGFLTSYPMNWWLVKRGIKTAM